MATYKNRDKISLIDLINKFPDDKTAETWFIKTRWNDSITCPRCLSNKIKERTTKMRSWRCNDCRKDFSTKISTLMQGSNLGFRVWAIAIYLLTTNLKGVASTKLASDLNITQKTAWHLAMRIRETYKDNAEQLSGIVEVDETYVGGKEKNKHSNKKSRMGQGIVNKQAVIGAKQRDGKIIAKPIPFTDSKTLKGFIDKNIKKYANIVTDNHNHYSVCHSAKEYVNGMAIQMA